MSSALLLAGVFGLAATLVLPAANFKKTSPRLATLTVGPKPSADAVPSEKERVPPVSDEELIKFCSANVTAGRSFVVFRRGTCVVINEPCKDPLAEARRIIGACVAPDQRFIAETTRDGDLIVSFTKPVFHRFSSEEVAKLSPWLDGSAAAYLTPSETIAAGEGWSPGGNARFGLLARRRLMEDSVRLVPTRIIRATSRAMAAN